MSKKNDWKKRDGVVYSTASDFGYQYQQENEINTPPAQQQQLLISLDKSGRAGKQVTVVKGFTGKTGDIETLSKKLKAKCGVGGAVKDREILIQGDQREKLVKILQQDGYKVKRGN
jgi:translation initiation factor 1